MLKPYRAVLIVQEKAVREVEIMAESDFSALTQAKQAFGAEAQFDLWEGQRRALIYRPSLAK